VALCEPLVSALSPRDRGASGDRRAGRSQCRSCGRDRVPRRDEVIDDDDLAGSDRPAGDELAGGRRAALGRRQPGRIRSRHGDHERRRHPRRDAPSAEHPDGAPRQPLDMLPAAAPRDRWCRRNRHQHQRARHLVRDLEDGSGQCGGQDAGEIPATPLLVGDQARAHRPGVAGADRDRR
jgi:hypothetical protein